MSNVRLGIPNIWKDEAAKVIVPMEDGAGEPLEGLADSDVTVRYVRDLDGALQNLSPAGIWAELADGLYRLSLAAGIVNQEGAFALLVDTVASGNTATEIHTRIVEHDEAPDNAGIATIQAQTDKFQFNGAEDVKATLDGEEVSIAGASRAQLVDEVWDEAASGHEGDGTMGAAVEDAGAAFYQVFAAPAYDRTTQRAVFTVWLQYAGQKVATPTSCRIIARDSAGATVLDATSVLPVNGFFVIEKIPFTFAECEGFSVEAQVVYGGVTYISGESWASFN